jgi:hypothetical protein
VPVTFAREGRDERRINAISKKRAPVRQKMQNPIGLVAPICAQFFGSVNRSWSFATGD